MRDSLPTLYKKTSEFHNIPKKMRPAKNSRWASRGEAGEHLIAEGVIPNEGYFYISASQDNTDLQMWVFRSDNTLLAHEQYDPMAFAYSHRVTTYDETGNIPIHYTAHSKDGRLVEEIAPNSNKQLERMLYYYPNLDDVMYFERKNLGNDIPCEKTTERTFLDKQGKRFKQDRIYNAQMQCVSEVYYHDNRNVVNSIAEFKPGTRQYTRLRSLTESGLTAREATYDDKGKMTASVEYDTEEIGNAPQLKKKTEDIYEGGKLRYKLAYHKNEALKSRSQYAENGFHVQQVELFNEEGALESTSYYQVWKADKPSVLHKRVEMDTEKDPPEMKRMVLFSYDEKAGKSKPYRGRELKKWAAGDEVWTEVEYDPETGKVMHAITPTPNGFRRHHYDEKTGNVEKTEFFREPELGETLERVQHYYPPKPKAPGDKENKPLVTKRDEYIGQDGTTVTHTHEFRTDGSIKFHDDFDEHGRKIRKAYAPGTTEVDDLTSPIFESITRADGTLESSSLMRAHANPDIVALHKTYGIDGKPIEVHVETLDGEETLEWQDYVRKRAAEMPPPVPAARIATVSPELVEPVKGKLQFLGETMITMQGDVDSLQRVRSQLRKRFTDIKSQIFSGDNSWLQRQGEVGHYVEPSQRPDAKGLERVNVLQITIPYSKQEGDDWPRTFARTQTDSKDFHECSTRSHKEAVSALNRIFRYTSCDLGISAAPLLGEHKTGDATEYRPFVRVRWPQHSHTPQIQTSIIQTMLMEQFKHRGYTAVPDAQCVDVICAPTSDQKGTAELIAIKTAEEITHGFTPQSPSVQRK